jgi:hypothetical protein
VVVVVQVTDRDEAMLGWLNVVRMADLEALKFALAGLAGADAPVGKRRANQWVARMEKAGWVTRTRPTYMDSSIIWATPDALGRPAPSLFRMTTRHEVAVAAVSARYLFHGYTWARDRRPAGMADHQADGVATKGDVVELIEVELSAKRLERYKLIHESHAVRLAHDGFSRVAYLGTGDAIRTVVRQADRFMFRTERDRLVGIPVFDSRGIWKGDDPRLWAGAPQPGAHAVPSELPGMNVFDEAPR